MINTEQVVQVSNCRSESSGGFCREELHVSHTEQYNMQWVTFIHGKQKRGDERVGAQCVVGGHLAA